MIRVDEVVGVVLGAGSSKRFGRAKQTLPFGDTTLLAHVVGDVEASALDRVVVVLGGAADGGRRDRSSRRGPRSSSTTAYDIGLRRRPCSPGSTPPATATAIMLLLGDMPGVTAAVIDPVRRGVARRRPTWAAVTAYADGIGHPFVFSADAFPTLRSLHGDKAVWKIVDREPDERVARIAVDRAAAPRRRHVGRLRRPCARRSGSSPRRAGQT